MIKILSSKSGGYFVRYVANNGQIIASSEILNTKASALKNARAMAKIFKVKSLAAKDCTGDKPKMVIL